MEAISHILTSVPGQSLQERCTKRSASHSEDEKTKARGN